jgi:DMSO/TMAO reductase YedYZ molybdopterin-dependent catalytic subunit
MFAGIKTNADFALVHSYGDYTTNLPLEALMNKQAWIAFRFDDEDLAPEHGGPARITLMHEDQPGFWETLGYHNYGDPWREQRYWDD